MSPEEAADAARSLVELAESSCVDAEPLRVLMAHARGGARFRALVCPYCGSPASLDVYCSYSRGEAEPETIDCLSCFAGWNIGGVGVKFPVAWGRERREVAD